jgi:Ca2+-binding RTX toxin-like protein
MADLGPGSDKLRVEGSLLAVGSVRFAGNLGNDTIHAGPEDDLIEAGPGSDHLYGGDGADGLVGGLPGPTYLYGEGNGDLLAAGGGCAGGALVGGPGRDDASFAETQAHPGLLIVSFPRHSAWVTTVKGCRHVHLSRTNEDMEGSFDWDVLIGDGRANSMLGQPGEDVFIGNGGDDVIDARDGVRDKSIQCGVGKPPVKKPGGKGMTKPTGKSAGRALTDSFDPEPFNCAVVRTGTPVPGLNG